MKWILVLIFLNHHSLHSTTELGRYSSMQECFQDRQRTVEQLGKPIINYQAICVRYDKELLLKQGKPSTE